MSGKFFSALMLLILAPCVLWSQSMIITNNDETYSGFINSKDDVQIVLQTLDGNEVKIPTGNIREITPITSTVLLKSGTSYQGTILKLNSDFCILKTASGTEIKIEKHKIKTIRTENDYEISFDNHSTPVRSYETNYSGQYGGGRSQRYSILNSQNNDYSMFGASLICPGGINLIWGRQFTKHGIRAEIGMIPEKMFGMQLNYLFNLDKRESFEHNISVGIGYSYLKDNTYVSDSYYNLGGYVVDGYGYYRDDDWTYAGVFYDINIYGLFLEGGITIGSGDFSNPQLSFQIGYVYRFNN